MIPTAEDFIKSSARWSGEHQGVSYEISWHGCSEYNPNGTWCYYIMLTSEQFNNEDWRKLALRSKVIEFGGVFRVHWSYENFPDLDEHGGWTFGEMRSYLGRDGKRYKYLKVGCDYAHLYDQECGNPYTLSYVEDEAKHSIDILVKMFPNMKPRN